MTTTLLDPISETTPTGADLSFSPAFDQIAELRRFDDPTLDQGEWVREIKSADWPGVARLCSELLSTQTKDMRLAGWMTEALSRTRGFAGMAEGLGVCAGLCETFWDALHPLADEDAPANEPAERFEQRIGNLKWLKHLIDALIKGADVNLELAKQQGRDELIANERWGVRDTSANWSTHVFPALEDFRKSTIKLIAWRVSEGYCGTGANQCARMIQEFSSMWMTEDEETQFKEQFEKVYHYVGFIDFAAG